MILIILTPQGTEFHTDKTKSQWKIICSGVSQWKVQEFIYKEGRKRNRCDDTEQERLIKESRKKAKKMKNPVKRKITSASSYTMFRPKAHFRKNKNFIV